VSPDGKIRQVSQTKTKTKKSRAKPLSHHALSVRDLVLEAVDFGVTKVLFEHEAEPRLLGGVECGTKRSGVLRSGGAQLVHLTP